MNDISYLTVLLGVVFFQWCVGIHCVYIQGYPYVYIYIYTHICRDYRGRECLWSIYSTAYIYIIWLYVYIQAEGTPIFRPWHAPWILPQRSQKMQNSFLSLCHSTDKKWVLTNLINYMIWVTFVYDMRQVPLPFAHVAVLHPATISSFSHQEKSRSRRSKGTRRQRIFPDIWAVSRGGETPGVLAIKHVVEYITWLSRGGSKHV